MITNGYKLELWQNRVFQENHCILHSEVLKLADVRGELEAYLSPHAVMAFLEKHDVNCVSLEGVDVGPYLTHLGRTVFEMPLFSRQLRSSNSIITLDLEADDGELRLNRGDRWFVRAWGGRGKTSILQLLIRKTLKDCTDGRRMPIYLPLKQASGGLFDRIAVQLRPFVPQLGTTNSVMAWLKRSSFLLLLDDSHVLSDSDRANIERDIEFLGNDDFIVVATGSKATQPFKLTNMRFFELNQLSDKERDELIPARDWGEEAEICLRDPLELRSGIDLDELHRRVQRKWLDFGRQPPQQIMVSHSVGKWNPREPSVSAFVRNLLKVDI